jgi:hypothetical protein
MVDVERLKRDEYAAALAIRRATKRLVREYDPSTNADGIGVQALSLDVSQRFIDCYYRTGLVGGGQLSLRSVAKVFETLVTCLDRW